MASPSILKAVDALEKLASKYLSVSSEKIDGLHTEARSILWPLAHALQRASSTAISEMAVTISKHKPDMIEKLSEGMLARFVNELKIAREVKSKDFSLAILALETLFMEWSCEQTMREILIRVGAVHLLFQQLKLYSTIIVINRETNKYVFTSALTISNCAETDADLFMHFHGDTAILSILEPYSRSSDPLISSCAQFIRNYFSWYLNKAETGSVDCPDHIEDLIDRLPKSFSPVPLTATEISVEPAGILNMLRQLSVSQSNRNTLLKHPSIKEMMSRLLQGKQEVETVTSVLNLLLGLLSPSSYPKLGRFKPKGKPDPKRRATEDINYQVPELLMKSLPEIVLWLENLDCQSVSKLQELRDAVLHVLQTGSTVSDVQPPASSMESILNQCYEQKHYEVVILLASTKTDKNDECIVTVTMKARYQLYCREQIVLQRKEKDLSTLELDNARHALYSEARKIVAFFVTSKLRENKEVKEMLDNMLMDIIRDLNEASGNAGPRKGKHGPSSKSFFNCILCHSADEIIKGHFWAKSHILAIHGKDKKHVRDRASLHKKPDLKKVSNMVYYMFCGRCDNEVLSADENYFSETILRAVYPQLNSPLPTKEHHIAYKGPSLYRFCLGMALKALTIQKTINNYTNSTAVYRVFLRIRQILLSTGEIELDQDFPNVLMFYTPTTEEIEEQAIEGDPSLDETVSTETTSVSGTTESVVQPAAPQKLMFDLKSALEDSEVIEVPVYIDGSDFSQVSYIPLYSKTLRNRHKAHFLFVKHGIFNIVILLEPEVIHPEHEQFIISPKGGLLPIPPNNHRMASLPPAIIQAFKERVPHFLKELMEDDSKISQLNSLQRISASIKTESAESAVPSNIIEHNINLLPIKYGIDRTSNKLHLPSNHRVLIHSTQYGQSTNVGETVLLVVDDSEWSCPYVIVHKFTPNMLISLGYYVSQDDFCFVKRLKEENHRGMELIVQQKDPLLELAAQMVPRTLLRVGLADFGSLMLCHLSGFEVDRKCIPNIGCWYCSLSCEVCRTPHYYGTIFKSMSDTLYSFCSEDCLEVFGDPGFDDKFLEVADSEGVQPSVEKANVYAEKTRPVSRKGQQDRKCSNERIKDDKTVCQGVALEEVKADGLDTTPATPKEGIFSEPSKSLEEEEDKYDEAALPTTLEEPIAAEDEDRYIVIAKVKEQSSKLTKPETGSIELELPISEPSRETKRTDRKGLEEEDREIVNDENLTPMLQEMTVKIVEADDNELDDTIARPKECLSLKSLTCHNVLTQMNDTVLLMVTTGIYLQSNGTKLRVIMKLFHAPQEINIITIIPNTYFIICFLQSAHEQYLDVCSLSIEGCLCETITRVKDEDDSVSFSERKQVLCDVLQNGLHMCNVKILSSLL